MKSLRDNFMHTRQGSLIIHADEGSGGSAAFDSLEGDPTDNAALAAALATKVDKAGDTMNGQLNIASGIITANDPALNITQTWDNAAVGFKAILANIISLAADYGNTALIDLQRNGTTVFKTDHGGSTMFGAGNAAASTVTIDTNGFVITLRNGAHLDWMGDTKIWRAAAGVLERRNGADAQSDRLYGTYTDASNYRRLAISSTTAGVFAIAPEGAGTGASGNVLHLSGLPTANPGPGILWNNSGTPAIGT